MSTSLNSVVLAAYFNHKKDPQRRKAWAPDINLLRTLTESVNAQGCHTIIFHNCFSDDQIEDLSEIASFRYVEGDADYQPTVFRWFCYRDYLNSHRHESVFMVDSTDVEMLRNPFPEMESNTLYSGDEYNRRLNATYIIEKQAYIEDPEVRGFLGEIRRKRLLNAGICGGDWHTVTKFLEALTHNHSSHSRRVITSTDMPIYNYTIRRQFESVLCHGYKINTRFKKNERKVRTLSPRSWLWPTLPWWKHK